MEQNIKIKSHSFYGGVIYIDLRGYTEIVDQKPLYNIAKIIYSYQNSVKLIMKNFFTNNEIKSIQFVGDAVMTIIMQNDNYCKHLFNRRIFDVSYKLKREINSLLEEQKKLYSGLNDLDFGIGISSSNILCQTVIENDLNKRKIYFGNSLNRACKIGDSMSSKKNHIGIDIRIFNEMGKKEKSKYLYFLFNHLFKKNKRPFAHLYEFAHEI